MKFRKIIPLAFVFIGLFLLMQIILPVVSFQLWELGQNMSDNLLISPKSNVGNILGVSIEDKDSFPAFISHTQRDNKPNYSKFSLTINKLKLNNIEVFLDSNDLQKGLVHLPGSAIPGEKGNVFISGHSAASVFFPIKKAYFSKLQDLKKGDEIVVEASGSRFVYQVVGIKVVNPKDLSVVNPPDEQGRYISLMTCVPPGLNFKRLVVLGKML
ncbi:class E sortase [Candidatus Daviesbacteria bacterium]|nr:class E sortase [Candidatus Daviesbacteria bacterium]